jgi:plastocyanin
VEPGATITVKNKDSVTHTLSATGDGKFNTGNIKGGTSATFAAPSKAGTYTYMCQIHNYMRGTLRVR